LAQRELDFAGLYAKSTNLDLVIATAYELNAPLLQMADDVPGTIYP
jgi:hypothetical protein